MTVKKCLLSGIYWLHNNFIDSHSKHLHYVQIPNISLPSIISLALCVFPWISLCFCVNFSQLSLPVSLLYSVSLYCECIPRKGRIVVYSELTGHPCFLNLHYWVLCSRSSRRQETQPLTQDQLQKTNWLWVQKQWQRVTVPVSVKLVTRAKDKSPKAFSCVRLCWVGAIGP